MDFRKLCFGSFSKLGLVVLAGLIAIGTSQMATESTVSLPPNEIDDNQLHSHHNATDLQTILSQQNLLSTMADWHGKALFIQIDKTSSPHNLRHYHYNALYQDSNQNNLQDPDDLGFFNPASTVKVAIAALTLETLNTSGLTRQAEYRAAGTDTWHRFEEDIRRALVISDNDATNRLMLWLGFDNINSRLANKGLSDLILNRLMLDRGTLIPSPAFEMRLNGQRVQQPAKPVDLEATCYETPRKIGNCATASALIQSLIRVNQPEYFTAEEGFSLSVADGEWLQGIMSRTPREEGFTYADSYCRFLTGLEENLAGRSGKMLSKCGLSLFTNTYTDLSYLQTDTGQEYYILLSVRPPSAVPEADVIDQMSQIAEAVLAALTDELP